MSTTTRQPRVFISRTTAGLAVLAERVAEVLRQRGIEPIIQTGFYPSTHNVKGMRAEHLQQWNAVICLIGSASGYGPHKGPVVINEKRIIHGSGGFGTIQVAIEYSSKHADDYQVSASSSLTPFEPMNCGLCENLRIHQSSSAGIILDGNRYKSILRAKRYTNKHYERTDRAKKQRSASATVTRTSMVTQIGAARRFCCWMFRVQCLAGRWTNFKLA